MNPNRSYLRGAIIAIVVMIGTISAAYAAPTTSFVISGVVFYGNDSECNDPTVNIVNLNTSDEWVAETNDSSNYYQMVLDSDNVSVNDTLQFNATSPDESQSSVTEHVVTQDELNTGGFVYNITLAEPGDTTPPTINSVLLDPIDVEPSESINVTVNVTDASGIAGVTANGVPLADAGNDTWEGSITAESASGTYNVTVVATDNSTNSNNVTDDSATYTVTEPGDATPPTINSVVLDPIDVEPSESINVTVNVTDASGIAGVTANGVPLADAGNDTWEGSITAESASGTYNVTVVATDNSTNSNNVTDDSATYTVTEPGDATPPTINSVVLDPIDVEPSESINVTVNVTDASGIAGVTANGVPLADAGNDTWEGSITAESASGTYNVTVVATDNSTNSNNVTDDSATYTVTEPMPPTLSIEDVAVRRGENKTVPITVFDVVNMGGCEINFTYDPTVVYVTDVARGDLNFSFEYNINNGSGWMRANALDVEGRSGDVIFAYVTLTAVGNKSDTSEMEFEDSRLVDASFGEITHVRDNGTFSILPNVPPEVTNVSRTPDTILYDNGRPRTPGTNITSLSAQVTDTDGDITTVTINLSSIGGLSDQPMEHVSGDQWEVTTNATEVAINAPDFTHQLTITATDDDGGINDSVSIELTVLKRGDVNGDGLVDRMDADYISRYLAGLEPEASILVGDVVGEAGAPVGNGVVDLMDALYLAKYTKGMVGEP